MSTVPFRAPTGVHSSPPAASPDSLIGSLRAKAAERRENEELTVDIPGRWAGVLRVRYGYISLDEIEQYEGIDLAHVSNIGMTLDMLSKSVKAVEGFDQTTGEWAVVKDAAGPVTFDDRFARLLDWPRPDDDYEYSIRQVYEALFENNGLAIGQHIGEVGRWMGVFEEELASGKDSTSGGPMPSAPLPPSE